MKSAYELAMERLSKTAPVKKLSAEQKQQIAELNSRYAAKRAELDLRAEGELAQAAASGDEAQLDTVRQRLADERRRLEAELEEKKESIRQQSEPKDS
jgi:hypothetical protein